MHRSAILVAITVLLSACGSDASGDQAEAPGEYAIDAETGEASMTIETENGSSTVRSGENVPVELPAGFSVYPGAAVINNTSFKDAETHGSMLVMETKDSPEEVAAFYRKQAEEAGIPIEFEMDADGAQILGGKDGTGRTITLNATPESEITMAQLLVGFDPAMAGD